MEEKVEFSIVELAHKFQLPIPKLLEYIKLIQSRGYWQFIESEQSVPKLNSFYPTELGASKAGMEELLTSLYRMYPSGSDAPVRIDQRFTAGTNAPRRV